jgi:hypothetical protein
MPTIAALPDPIVHQIILYSLRDHVSMNQENTSQYPNGFLMDVLCSILQKNIQEANISELKCSERLGVARFDLGGNTILLY